MRTLFKTSMHFNKENRKFIANKLHFNNIHWHSFRRQMPLNVHKCENKFPLYITLSLCIVLQTFEIQKVNHFFFYECLI